MSKQNKHAYWQIKGIVNKTKLAMILLQRNLNNRARIKN